MKRTPFKPRTKPLARSGVLARPLPAEPPAPSPQRAGGRPRTSRPAGSKPRGNPIPAEARATVRARSAGLCEVRGPGCTTGAQEQHHRQRRRDGGHAVSNLLDTCSPCHRHVHANPRAARAAGFIVSAFEGADLQTVPIRRPGTDRTTCLLDDGQKITDLGSDA